MEKLLTDILVIGGGLCGMMASLEAFKQTKSILLICKGKVGNSGASLKAGSNFAAVLPDAMAQGDSISSHVEDTISAGAYLNDLRLVEILAKKAPENIFYLEQLGVEFLKKEGHFDLRKPPGHRNFRTVFTKNPGFPLTIRGKSFTRILRQAIIQKDIPFLEGVSIVKIIVDNGKICGAIGVFIKNGEILAIECEAIIIACGGGASLYELNTNPGDVTGDSYSLGIEAGCLLRDIEFVQFYPCVYIGPPRVPIYSPILSDGGILRNKEGERFLARYEPERMEQATRDVVSQAIIREINAGKGVDGAIYLDLTKVPQEVMSFRYPDLLTLFKKQGIDLHKQWIKVTPAAHYFMGGIAIDEYCRTNIEGLFAAGEAAGGIHGANRLSGNGLSDPLVFGRIAAQQAIQYVMNHRKIPMGAKFINSIINLKSEKISRKEIEEIRKKIKHLMWEKVGIIRNKLGLMQAIQNLEELQRFFGKKQPETKECLGSYFEIRSMLIAAQAISQAALVREESRGAHFREDFPETKAEWAKSIYTRLEEGRIIASIKA